MIYRKDEQAIFLMGKAGKVVAQILKEMAACAHAGVSTADLNTLAEARCKEHKVTPAFKGYHGFPASVCISVNEEIVHGIPSQSRILKKGDLVGLDFGVIYQGWFGDSALTVCVDKEPEGEIKDLLEATQKSLEAGIEQCRVGNYIADISAAIQAVIDPTGFGIVREFVGHGIGRALHEDPAIPNFKTSGKSTKLEAGMVLAIEPMITLGSHKVKVLQDGWTAVTQDGSWAAHFEHTVAITKNGPKILTTCEN